MKYLLLIYHNDQTFIKKNENRMDQIMSEYNELTDNMKNDSVYLGGNALKPVSTATTVRVQNNKTVTTDGPFAETKEQLGGYYLLDCKNLDEAITYRIYG